MGVGAGLGVLAGSAVLIVAAGGVAYAGVTPPKKLPRAQAAGCPAPAYAGVALPPPKKELKPPSQPVLGGVTGCPVPLYVGVAMSG